MDSAYPGQETVGFGELHPATDAAKLVTVRYILLGLGVHSSFISELTKHRADALAELRDRNAHGDRGRR